MRSLSNRLALFFGLIVLTAIGIVYFALVPQLEERLRDQKLDRLADDAERYAVPLRRLVGLRRAAARPRARGAARGHARERGGQRARRRGRLGGLAVRARRLDAGGVEIDDVQSVAEAALATGRTARATEPTRIGRQALVAEPLIVGGRTRGVAVFADALTDVQDNVALIRNRILVAGAIALLIAVLAGYLVARALAARVKRLERAVRKVAAGDFSGRIEPDSDDELGQLGAAFDDMQRQLARLDHARKQFIARPRTSCARRSSRSAASSSCSRTRSSTRRRAASSSTTCASRSSA